MRHAWNFWSIFDIPLIFGSAKRTPLFALSDESEPSIAIDQQFESKAICFRAVGLPNSVLRTLSKAAPTDPRFLDRFLVAEIDERNEHKPVKGSYYVKGASLIFRPDQSLPSGGRYLAILFLPDPVTNRDVGSLFSLQTEFAFRPADIMAA